MKRFLLIAGLLVITGTAAAYESCSSVQAKRGCSTQLGAPRPGWPHGEPLCKCPSANPTAFAGASILAEVRTAKIQCEGHKPNDVYYLEAELQFPEGYVNYGPSRNKFEGQMNFAFNDGSDNSVVYSKVQGSQIVPSRYDEPEFWSFIAISNNGELIQINLQGLNDGFYFGTVERQNGHNYSARCQIQLSALAKREPRIPRHPKYF